METPGTDEPSPTAEHGAAEPPSAPPPAPPTPPPPPVRTGGDGGSDGGGDGDRSRLDEVEVMFEGGLEGDWPARAADAIVDVVGTVRDKTTGRITTVARGVVFGFFALVIGTAVAIMAIIAAIRLLDEALPSGVWLAYLVLGVVSVLAGALVFRKRNQPAPPAGNTGRP